MCMNAEPMVSATGGRLLLIGAPRGSLCALASDMLATHAGPECVD